MTDLRDQIDSIVTTKIATAILPAVFTTGHDKLAKEATEEIVALLPEDTALSGRALSREDGLVRDALNPLLSGEETAKLAKAVAHLEYFMPSFGSSASQVMTVLNALTTQASEIERLRGERDAWRRTAARRTKTGEHSDKVALDFIERATTAEAERDASKARIAELEKALQALMHFEIAHVGPGAYEACEFARTTLAAQQDQKGEAE